MRRRSQLGGGRSSGAGRLGRFRIGSPGSQTPRPAPQARLAQTPNYTFLQRRTSGRPRTRRRRPHELHCQRTLGPTTLSSRRLAGLPQLTQPFPVTRAPRAGDPCIWQRIRSRSVTAQAESKHTQSCRNKTAASRSQNHNDLHDPNTQSSDTSTVTEGEYKREIAPLDSPNRSQTDIFAHEPIIMFPRLFFLAFFTRARRTQC